MRKILFIISILTLSNSFIAQAQGYKIIVNAQNCKDSVLYLSRCYQQDFRLEDSAKIANNVFVFTQTDPIEEGMYVVTNRKNEPKFDFFITKNQQFTIECNFSDMPESLKATGDDENNSYFNFKRAVWEKSIDLISTLNQNTEKKTYIKKAKGITEFYNRFVANKYKEIFGETPDYLAAKYIKLSMPVPFGMYMDDKNGLTDSTRINPLYKLHYFDNTDFGDERLINTNLLTEKINFYLDTLCSQSIESLKPEIDKLLVLSKKNEKMQQYMVWFLLNKFESPKFWGLDALYVYIFKTYIKSGKTKFIYPSMLYLIENKAELMEPLLIGEHAKNLIMKDLDGNIKSLFGVQAKYTLLLFWATTCSHCREEMPAFKSLYKDFRQKYNMEIFAVSTDTSYNRWRKYTERQQLPWINVFGRKPLEGNYHKLYNIVTTPTVFVLDEKKRIIAKQIPPDKIRTFIENDAKK